MTNKKGMLFTAGQFAALHNINKRTLLYYDDIGLFSPAFKKENGYRYYTYFQSPALEMLLTLRDLDMSIEEIKQYMTNRSPEALLSLVNVKISDVDAAIKRLTEIRNLLEEKEKRLRMQLELDTDVIEVVECPQEYLFITGSIDGTTYEDDVPIILEHAKKYHDKRLFNHTFGCMLATDKVLRHNFTNYDYFFTKINEPTEIDKMFIKPAGSYIKAYCKGEWSKLPNTYKRIVNYATEHNLTLSGYAYEEGINELAINQIDEYITQIMVYCE